MMTDGTIGLETRIQQSPDRVAATIDEITAIMDAEKEVYYLIDAIGSVLWTRMEQPISVGDLCDQLLAEYAVDPADCQRDVLAFCRDMVERNLVVAV